MTERTSRVVSLMVWLCVAATACGSDGAQPTEPVAEGHPAFDPYAEEVSGVTARYELTANDWHATPFPTDLRRDPDTGKIDLSGFPAPTVGEPEPLIETYRQAAEATLTGFSVQPTVYVQLDGPIRSNLLPTAQETATADNAGVWLINVDAKSPHYGERVPLRVRVSGAEDGTLLRANVLMAQPTWGTPLREDTAYALVVSRAMRDTSDRVLGRPLALASAIDGLTGASAASGDPKIEALAKTLAPLVEAWRDGHVPLAPRAIAAATVFTTGRPTAQLSALADWIRAEAPRKAAFEWKQDIKKHDGYRLYRGRYEGPNFQAGEPPYLDTGGGFVFDEAGAPVVQKTEKLRLSVAVPDDRVHAVGGLLPVVIYSHGTGGSYESYRNGGAQSPAKLLTSAGMVVIGIDQPLHGPRAGDSPLPKEALYLASFNFFNPAAGQTVFRQGAADNIFLIEMLRDGKLDIPGDVTHDGEAVRLDPNRMLFMGHSQGGLVGGMLATVESNLRGVVLSGAGGGLSLTAVTRKDIVNFPNLIKARLNLKEGELSEFHPGVTLIQHVVDVTDPLAYGRLVLQRPKGVRPPHLLMTEGLLDEATPAVTAEALAASIGLHLLQPAAQLSEAMEVLQTPIQPRPVSNNLTLGEEQVTAVLSQYPKGDHFVVFDDPKAALLARDFLVDVATTGEAIIQ